MASTTDPNASYYQSVIAAESSKDPGVSMYGAAGALAAPTIAGQEQTIASAEQQLGNLGPGLKQQSDYATAMAGYQLGGLGINQQQTGLQQQGTEQGYALTQQAQAEQGQKNQVNFTQQLQSLIGGQAASGALNTGGAKQKEQLIGQESQWAAQDLSRAKQQSAGDYARAQKNYELVGKANGLSAAEVETRLGYGLEQLGQSADPASLMAQMGGALSGQAQGIGGVLSQAGLIGGVNASAALGALG